MDPRDNPLRIIRLTIFAFVCLVLGLSMIGEAKSQAIRNLHIAYSGPDAAHTGPLVLTHDDYDWIYKGGYRNKEGDHCCGKDDCRPLDKSEIREVPGGWEIPSLKVTVPHNQTIPSEDGKFWACWTSVKFRCLFVPYSGS